MFFFIIKPLSGIISVAEFVHSRASFLDQVQGYRYDQPHEAGNAKTLQKIKLTVFTIIF